MRNLLPYYIIVAIGFSLQPAFLSAQTGENWWKREFTIGLNLDPPQRTSKPGWNSSVLWDSVSSAGFNLSVGLQYKHGVRTDTVHPATRAANSNVRYLYHDGNFMKKSVASSGNETKSGITFNLLSRNTPAPLTLKRNCLYQNDSNAIFLCRYPILNVNVFNEISHTRFEMTFLVYSPKQQLM